MEIRTPPKTSSKARCEQGFIHISGCKGLFGLGNQRKESL